MKKEKEKEKKVKTLIWYFLKKNENFKIFLKMKIIF